MPDTNKKVSEFLSAHIKPDEVDPTVRHPDGTIDPVQTALNKLRFANAVNPKPKQSTSMDEMTQWLKEGVPKVFAKRSNGVGYADTSEVAGVEV